MQRSFAHGRTVSDRSLFASLGHECVFGAIALARNCLVISTKILTDSECFHDRRIEKSDNRAIPENSGFDAYRCRDLATGILANS